MTFHSDDEPKKIVIQSPEGDIIDYMTIDEIKVLYRLLENQYISHENTEALAIVRKIVRLIDEYELAEQNNQAT
jgi:hypothetical protein